MFFEYTKDCMTGIEQIDGEHKYLFGLMNQLMEAVHGSFENASDGIESYVEMLVDYGKVHFAHEEAYLEETGDRELSRQRGDHALFLRKMQSLDLTGLNVAEKRKILEDTLGYLTRWLYNHILGSDTLIGKVEHIAEHVMDEDEFCRFTDKYRTGIEAVDEEHRGLFAIIGSAYRLVESGDVSDRYDDIMSLLDQLEDYAKVHFGHEEEYMEQIQYPYLEAQRRAHGMFLDRLNDKDFGESHENQQEYLEELLDFLYAWLGNHILKMDKPVGEYTVHG